MRKSKSGFTIVELLIVIVVIAILATISIVAYTGVQNRANDSAIQSDLQTLSKKYELYRIDSSAGVYPYGSVLGTGTNTGFSMTFSYGAYQLNNNMYNVLNCTASSGSSYAVLAQSKSGKYFTVGSADGVVKEATSAVSLADGSSCPTILAGSTASGTAYSSGTWRNWAKGN